MLNNEETDALRFYLSLHCLREFSSSEINDRISITALHSSHIPSCTFHFSVINHQRNRLQAVRYQHDNDNQAGKHRLNALTPRTGIVSPFPSASETHFTRKIFSTLPYNNFPFELIRGGPLNVALQVVDVDGLCSSWTDGNWSRYYPAVLLGLKLSFRAQPKFECPNFYHYHCSCSDPAMIKIHSCPSITSMPASNKRPCFRGIRLHPQRHRTLLPGTWNSILTRVPHGPEPALAISTRFFSTSNRCISASYSRI
jgi:hypothetical protein